MMTNSNTREGASHISLVIELADGNRELSTLLSALTDFLHEQCNAEIIQVRTGNVLDGDAKHKPAGRLS